MAEGGLFFSSSERILCQCKEGKVKFLNCFILFRVAGSGRRDVNTVQLSWVITIITVHWTVIIVLTQLNCQYTCELEFCLANTCLTIERTCPIISGPNPEMFTLTAIYMFKWILILVSVFSNNTLVWKIMKRKHLHSVFNLSMCFYIF
jgi:hypothetical protein